MITIFPYILVLYEIINYLANDMYLPALPSMASDLSLSSHQAQMTLTVWFLGTGSLHLILGPLSDRIGRKPVLLGGCLLFLVSSIICATTSTLSVLLIARYFQGCAVCAINTAGYSTIHECYTQHRAIQLIGIMASITVLAPAFGPLLGGLILVWKNWRWIFGILAVSALIVLILLSLFMPESNPKEKRHPIDWKLIYRNYVSIISNSHFRLYTFISGFMFLGIILWIAAGPFLVIEGFKRSIFTFGFFQVLIFGSVILATQLVKFLLTKMTLNNLINLGLIISCVGSILTVILSILFPNFILGLIYGLMIVAFGGSLMFGTTNRLAIEACAEPIGAKMAVFSSLMSMFGVMGGLLVSLTYHPSLLWFSSILFLVSASAGIIMWTRKV